MPITLKLNLASTGVPNGQPSTPSVKIKLPPSTHQPTQNAEAGPSTPPPRPPPTPATSTPLAGTKMSKPPPSFANMTGMAKKTPGSSQAKPKKAKPSTKVQASKSREASLPRPTAIPPRLLSSGPSTPKSAHPALPFDTPTPATSVDVPLKSETEDDGDPDPLSLPLSPSAMEVSTPHSSEPGQDTIQVLSTTPQAPPERAAPKWQRVKKPLKELLNKIMVELRRRDEYALFEEPVNTNDFPDYLAIVGGEENMMDLGTMQSKVDEGEYRSIDDIEVDLRKLVTAAQTFNPPGTIPHNSAGKILAYGLKHIDRSRPIVRTPSPSPERFVSENGTPARGQSTFSGREGTAPLAALTEIPPQHYIPVEMLEYPPNSLFARAVGWNMNGGRHIWSKRQLRGREKFTGKWRHWTLDGTRDMAELEDPDEWFANTRTSEEETFLRKIDWKRMRKEGVWWETELGGPQGQPPLPFTPYAKPTPMRHRTLGPLDFGIMPEIDAELRLLANSTKQPEHVALSEQLRPLRRKAKAPATHPQSFVNVFEGHLDVDPRDVLSQAMFGDTTGEAYSRSLNEFVQGAMQMAGDAPSEEDAKPETDTIPLDEWVAGHYRQGLMGSGARKVASQTLSQIATLSTIDADSTAGTNLQPREAALYEVAKREYGRRALQYLTLPRHQLDIASLLTQPSDFMFPGLGGKTGVTEGLEWVSKEIGRLADEVQQEHDERIASLKRKREDEASEAVARIEGPEAVKRIKVEETAGLDSTASSPLSQAPDSPSKEGGAVVQPTVVPREAALRRLRLELVALSKFYPLVALKKMSKEEAERLLPVSVRALMSKK